MKTIKSIIATTFLIVGIVPFCHSQKKQYRNKLRPIVEAKLDSLYPHATYEIYFDDYDYVSDTTQVIDVNCHCEEVVSKLILVFDTNGNLLIKEAQYDDIKQLPDTVVKYMKKNTSLDHTFDNNYMIKTTTNKGDITYGIVMRINTFPYLLTFKSSGELISKKLAPSGSQ